MVQWVVVLPDCIMHIQRRKKGEFGKKSGKKGESTDFSKVRVKEKIVGRFGEEGDCKIHSNGLKEEEENACSFGFT
ncbi:unnamed protein product [Amaranthus hypochondriacus]